MKIYHNPRCSKSRQTLNLIQEKGGNIEIIEYLKDNLSVIELEEIIEKLENHVKMVLVITVNQTNIFYL